MSKTKARHHDKPTPSSFPGVYAKRIMSPERINLLDCILGCLVHFESVVIRGSVRHDVVMDHKSTTFVRIITLSKCSPRAIFPMKVLMLNFEGFGFIWTLSLLLSLCKTHRFENSAALELWTLVFARKATVISIVLWFPEHPVFHVLTVL